MSLEDLFQVGEYIEEFNIATGQDLPCGPIYQSYGLRAHIQKRHPASVEEIHLIPKIIAEPDYVGKHPKEPNSLELVKVIDGNVMVCIKLDKREGYLFVASMFEISAGKLRNRLNSGRLKQLTKITDRD